ncbi:MAG: L,D-transpeptidase/peptidoglycan binding protein [Eubacterium sp.]|nr:L,D-transpeptidase/peptidoglycan binding protein [Eubacterium sp.]
MIYFSGRWYNNTLVNGIDLSGMTLEESKEELAKQYADYSMIIKARKDGSMDLKGADFDYVFEAGSQFDQLFTTQHQGFTLLYQGTAYNTEYQVNYNKDKLSKLLNQSVLVKGSNDYEISKPTAAKVAFSKNDNEYIIEGEDEGNLLKKDEFLTLVEESLQKGLFELDLTAEANKDVYESPSVKQDDQSIQEMLKAYNEKALRYVSWNLGQGVKEQITPKNIAKWIDYKNGKIVFDKEKIENFIEKICLKYKTVGKTRTILDHTGKEIEIVGGDYGWQIDYETMVKQAKKSLKKDIDPSLVNAYIENPTEENKRAITIKQKLKYLNEGFQRDFDNLTMDWDLDNYTEVDLGEQMIYVMRNGKVKFSCRTISGRPVEGRETPTGAFYVKEHREAYTLTGADYETPVTNWVRITWTGTGFHPATWQSWGSWSKDYYKTRGSHGCLNLQPADAKKIYDLVAYREAVFIHK